MPRGRLPGRDRGGSVPVLAALGDLLLDVVVAPEGPIDRGTDVPGTVTFRRGGSAATTAAVFARLGGRASLITSLGRDRLGSRLAASMRDDGVTVHAVRSSRRSGRLAAIIDADGERSFVTQRASADELDVARLRPAWTRGLDVIHVPAYSLLTEPIGTAAIAAAHAARQDGAIVSGDLSSTGPLQGYGIGRARARIGELGPDIIFANRAEAAILVRRTGRRAWPRLLELAPVVVVKDGAAGCRVLRRATDGAITQLDVATRRLSAGDTTGAGDAFAAGFLFTLATARRTHQDGVGRPGSRPATLRRAALAAHRAAVDALDIPQPTFDLG